MKMPFRSDPNAALEKTQAKLDSVELNLIALRAKRAETLLSAEDASAVFAIDKSIEIELANAGIYRGPHQGAAAGVSPARVSVEGI